MAEEITLQLDPRTTLGKKVRRLRREGITPVHLYGGKKESESLQCSTLNLLRVIVQAGRNTPVYVTVNGRPGRDLAMIRDVQRNPVKGEVLHVDFLRVQADVPITAEVPLTLAGDSFGARQASGSVVQQLYSLQVEALPLNIPNELEVDVSVLEEADMVIRAGDIELPPGVTLLTDPEALVARIEAARVEEVVEEEEEAVAEGEEGAEATGEQEGQSEEQEEQ